MDNLADLHNGVLKHAVRRRVRDHERRERVLVLGRLLLEVRHVRVALRMGGVTGVVHKAQSRAQPAFRTHTSYDAGNVKRSRTGR